MFVSFKNICLVFTENAHLLCKGKYRCWADLSFDWFGYDRKSQSVDNFNKAK